MFISLHKEIGNQRLLPSDISQYLLQILSFKLLHLDPSLELKLRESGYFRNVAVAILLFLVRRIPKYFSKEADAFLPLFYSTKFSFTYANFLKEQRVVYR